MRAHEQFLRPIAHRGLHDASRGIVENTAAAFDAAIARGYGIECDLRPGAGGLPLVFHDERLARLVGVEREVSTLTAADLPTLAYTSDPAARIQTFADMLAQIAGRVPLLVEVKSEWGLPDRAFLGEIARLAGSYAGPLALMSFDPGVLVVLRELAPDVPRGIVSGIYQGHDWWHGILSEERAFALSHLLESAPVEPSFYAYDVRSLPTPVTRYVREVARVPLFTWTVRSEADRATAARWADAPIFEGWLP